MRLLLVVIVFLSSPIDLLSQVKQFEREMFDKPKHQPTYAVTQDSCPLEFITLKTDFTPSKFFSSLASVGLVNNWQEYGVYVNFEVQNVSRTKIIGFRMGFISFDLFDEPVITTYAYSGILDDFLYSEETLTRMTSFTKRANEQSKNPMKSTYKEKWQFIFPNYSGHYTGIAFVDKVRFDNGTVWRANRDTVAQYVSTVFSNFQAELLSEEYWVKKYNIVK